MSLPTKMPDNYLFWHYTGGTIFRSAEMSLCQLFIQSESAYACVSELGELCLVQFKDLNLGVNLFQRKFVSEVRRCHEMERKLRFIENEIKKDGIQIVKSTDVTYAPAPREIVDLETIFDKIETELKEVNQNSITLKKNFYELTEIKHLLNKTKGFLESMNAIGLFTVEDPSRSMANLNLRFVAGVINREKLGIFERMLWRACRGNVFMRQAEIDESLEDAVTGQPVNKNVFIIFFQGDQLKTIVSKICEGYRATIYQCPDNAGEREIMLGDVMLRLDDLNIILRQTTAHRNKVLVNAAKNINNWNQKVKKMKAIYHTLNLFNLDVTQKCLIGECWVPFLDLKSMHMALRRGTSNSGSAVPPIVNIMNTHESPPTFNHVNIFTIGFQTLINSYGIASYREINPAPFTIISFPFLFATMFGDMGHGVIMTLFASVMISKEKIIIDQPKSEIYSIFFGGRYIIFLMGIFSIYAGLIYNDIFGKSVNFFGSSWKVSNNSKSLAKEADEYFMLDPAYDYMGDPYPVGLDPVWNFAKNKIIFENSFKMKVSIIFGICHMLFGVILSLLNHIYFKSIINIMGEFLPQIIFLMALFLYMVILMFIKWFKYYATNDRALIKVGTRCAPSILITFINMMLNKKQDFEKECESPFMFPNQKTVQHVLVITALVCIPWMLLSKPLLLMYKRKKKRKAVISDLQYLETTSKVHEEPMGEIFMHQTIHTIEYVLGSISHTASYLRLWALSLAHAQLSHVLWEMVLRRGFMLQHWSGAILLYIVFSAWAALTIAILVLMEGLSAFLHTLRLHWVEFQSKFYLGTGYTFEPFCLR